MRKSLLFLLLAFFPAIIFGETLHYYSNGKKIEVEEDFSSWSFIGTANTKASFALPEGVELVKKRNGVSIIKISDQTAITQLKANGLLFPAYIRNGSQLHVSGKLFVKIPGQPSMEKAAKWCEKHGLKLIKQYRHIPQWYLVSTEGNPINKAAELVEGKISEQAEPSFFIPVEKRAYIPNDPLFSNQWHLDNDGSNSKVSGSDHAHVAEAWEVLNAFKGSLGGKGIKLAIIDDGFDLDHEDLAGRFLPGHDFRGNDDDPTYENDKYYPDYSDMHGTSCAGVAGASTDNGKGVAGACPDCSIIPIRIDFVGSTTLDDSGIEAFEWAADAGADIMSNSWGPADNYGAEDMTQPLKDLVEELTHNGRDGKGIIILFAAGNGGESIDNYQTADGFANNPNVFAIGATNASGKRAYYSDYGPSLDFMAPSCDYANNGYGDLIDGIWTVDNTGKDGYNSGKSSLGDKNGNYTNDFGGTSSACPLAAGITGLILSANRNLTRDDVYEIYVETSDKVGGANYQNGFNEKYGYGRINACEAVKKALEMAGKNVSQVTCGGEVINPDPVDPDTGDTADSGDTGDSGDTADTGDPSTGCVSSADCESGTYCDAETGLCVPEQTDTGDTAADSGDTAADSGDTAADSGNTGAQEDISDTADSGDSDSDSGDTEEEPAPLKKKSSGCSLDLF